MSLRSTPAAATGMTGAAYYTPSPGQFSPPKVVKLA